MRVMKVERGTWTKWNGTVHEQIAVRDDRTSHALLSFEFDELDMAEQVVRDLLRLVAEWRAEQPS